MQIQHLILEMAQTIGGTALAGALAGLIYLGGMTWWERMRSNLRTPPQYQITMLDPDGIPIRKEEISAKSAARLIRDIEAGYYK